MICCVTEEPLYCLVTGAAGFIGSQIVDHLLAQGQRVIGVDKKLAYMPVDFGRASEIYSKYPRNFIAVAMLSV
jgi:UDP-glucose 4-epimerase